MSNWLKAGLIGAGVAVALSLLDFIPCAGCITWLLGLALYGCVGALAAYWMPPARMTGPAAGQGAVAALISSAIGGIVSIPVGLVQAAVLGPAQLALLRRMPPEILRQWEAMGIDPRFFSELQGVNVAGSLFTSTACCGMWLAIAAGVGALGAIIFVAIKSE